MTEVSNDHSPTKGTDGLPEGILRASTLEREHGLSRHQLRAFAASGKLLHLGRGLYSLPDSPITESHGLALVAARVPHGVICLASALQFHNLTTQNPWRVQLMLEHGARPPQIEYPPIFLVYASDPAFSAGVETHQIEGVSVKITCVAKTVADCFKYRSKIGHHVALEALREAIDNKKATFAELRQYAQICRVEKVMRPYMEMASL
jgi:predicted transcriptional regulator of viral defense system